MRFLSNYFVYSQSFLAAHLVVWGIALVLLGRLEAERRRLKREVAKVAAPGLSQTQVEKVIAPLASFDTYFEFCSSGFILIGLIGTIYGFAGAIPNLTNEGYDFHEFGNALSTSAFGIIWSLLFNALLTFYRAAFLDRQVHLIRGQQTLEDLGQTIARNLQEIGAEFVPHVKASLERFADASVGLSGATQELVAASRDSAEGFRGVASSTAETAAKVDQVLRKASKLPDSITTRLEEVFRAANDSLSQSAASLGAALRTLESIPEELRTKLEGAFKTQLDQLDAAGSRLRAIQEAVVREALDQSRQMSTGVLTALDGVLAEVRALPTAVSTNVVAGLRSIVSEVERTAGQLGLALSELEKIPPEIQRRLEEAFGAQMVALNSVREEFSTSQSQAYNAWAQRLQSIVDGFIECLKRTEGLPETIAGQTRTLTEAYRKVLEQQQFEMTEELRKSGVTIVHEQIDTLKQAAADQKRQAERLKEGLETVQDEERRRLHEAIQLALSGAVRWVEDYRKQLEQVEKELPEDIRNQQGQLITATQKASQSLLDCSVALGTEAHNIDRVLAQVNASMIDFKGVVGDMTQIASSVRLNSEPLPSSSANQELRSIVQSLEQTRAVMVEQATAAQRNARKGPLGWLFGGHRNN